MEVNGKVVQECKEPVVLGADLRIEAADAEMLIRDLAIDFEKDHTVRNQSALWS